MTPKTTKSSCNPTNRAHIERGLCSGWVAFLGMKTIFGIDLIDTAKDS